MSHKYQLGQVIYGKAKFHGIWDYMVVETEFPKDGKVFGRSLGGEGFYLFVYEDIIPKEGLESPLWKAMNEEN